MGIIRGERLSIKYLYSPPSLLHLDDKLRSDFLFRKYLQTNLAVTHARLARADPTNSYDLKQSGAQGMSHRPIEAVVAGDLPRFGRSAAEPVAAARASRRVAPPLPSP